MDEILKECIGKTIAKIETPRVRILLITFTDGSDLEIEAEAWDDSAAWLLYH